MLKSFAKTPNLLFRGLPHLSLIAIENVPFFRIIAHQETALAWFPQMQNAGIRLGL
jgi:hypothetical protein